MKFGVWGLGSIGMRHAKNAMAEGVSVAGYDPDASRCDLLKEEGGEIVSSEQDLLEQSDAVIICSPNHLHLEHLKWAIDHNCHVLIEKPLSHTSDTLEALFQQAKDRNLVIAPAMNMRFDDVVRSAKEIIGSGTYKKPLWARFVCSSYLPDWRPHQDHRQGYANDPKTGGVIFDIIHEFDIAYYLLGALQVTGCAAYNSGTIGLEADDCADILLQSERDKTPVSLHLDYISKNGKRYFEVQFEDHYMKADIDGRLIQIWNKDGDMVKEEIISQADTDCYIDEMKLFIGAVQGSGVYPCGPDEALDVLKTVIEARKMAGLPA